MRKNEAQMTVSTVARGTAGRAAGPRLSREARLRAEYAAFYPGIHPDRWASAAVLADTVLAGSILRGQRNSLSGQRVLLEAHFEFRGGDDHQGRPRREDR